MKDFYSYKKKISPETWWVRKTNHWLHFNNIWQLDLKKHIFKQKSGGTNAFQHCFYSGSDCSSLVLCLGGSEPMPDAPDVLSGLLAGDVLSSFTRPQWAVKPWPQRQGQYRNLILKHKNTTKGTKPWRLKWIWVLVQNRLSGWDVKSLRIYIRNDVTPQFARLQMSLKGHKRSFKSCVLGYLQISVRLEF